MSRSWARMVEKNKKKANQHRQKQGKNLLQTDGEIRFEGRSWLMPLVLVGLGVYLWFFFKPAYKDDGMFTFTVIGYIAVGLLIFFFKRPFLRVGQSRLSTRRFTGIKFAEADEIEEITVFPGYCIIQLKAKKKRWVFSKIVHLHKTDQMAIKLKDFAQRHSIPFKAQT